MEVQEELRSGLPGVPGEFRLHKDTIRSLSRVGQARDLPAGIELTVLEGSEREPKVYELWHNRPHYHHLQMTVRGLGKPLFLTYVRRGLAKGLEGQMGASGDVSKKSPWLNAEGKWF